MWIRVRNFCSFFLPHYRSSWAIGPSGWWELLEISQGVLTEPKTLKERKRSEIKKTLEKKKMFTLLACANMSAHIEIEFWPFI